VTEIVKGTVNSSTLSPSERKGSPFWQILVRKGFGDEKNRIWGSRKVEELTNVINI
jgi:hypothetical protein